MTRYAIFLTAVIATAASAIAAISPHAPQSTRNVTTIEKNQAFPQYGPIAVEPCAMEDCSDVT